MKKLHDYLIHAYMLASIVATLFVIPLPDMAGWCYALGGSSSLYAFAYILGDIPSALVGILSFGWMFLFPVLMVIFYLLAKKEIYLPFYIVTAIDMVVVLVSYFALVKIEQVPFGIPLLGDAIVSTVFCVLLGGVLLYRHNHLEKYL